MRDHIIAWLQGPRPYNEGAALYAKYGSNQRLRRLFLTREDPTLRGILLEELRRLSGLSNAAMRTLRRYAYTPTTPHTDAPEQETAQQTPQPTAADTATLATPEMTRRVLGFRERFPFLAQPDCPDILKILVSDMFTAYGAWKDARRRLLDLPADADLKEAASLAETVVEKFLEDDAMWRELEHYRDHGEILGEAPVMARYFEEQEVSKMTDLALIKAKNAAKANLSKNRKRLRQCPDTSKDRADMLRELVDKWERRYNILNAEEERREKNA